MRRRRFLELCAGGAVAGLVGCAPTVETETERDDSVRLLGGDGGAGPAPDGGAGGAVDAAAPRTDAGRTPRDAGPPARDAGPPDAGACDEHTVVYDTYAQALYFDGSLGPLTGVVYADYVLAGEPVEIEFWHGHGGVSHRYTVRPEHFEALKRGERVTLETTEVDSHSHRLFIDPSDPTYRVPGASPVRVPLC